MGTVRAVGKDVKAIKVGDKIHGMTWVHKTGSLSEYLAIDESAVNVVPKELTPQEAAALPLVAHTSYSSLVTMGGLRPGKKQKVLVLGGSSATGMMALQLVSQKALKSSFLKDALFAIIAGESVRCLSHRLHLLPPQR